MEEPGRFRDAVLVRIRQLEALLALIGAASSAFVSNSSKAKLVSFESSPGSVRLKGARSLEVPNTKMNLAMAAITKGDKVLGDIIPEQASRANMVGLEIVWTSAVLTSPSVSLQDLSAQFAVGIRVQPKPRPLRS
jgi:hypothetical protein